MAEKIKYTDAIEELEQIVEEIESGEISIDQLADKVKRASELIKVCKTKLRSTEEEVQKVLKEIQSNDATDVE